MAEQPYTWDIRIDWDSDGLFSDETSLDTWAVDFTLRKGRRAYITNNGEGFEPIPSSELSITFENSDGRFDPYNSSSPYYPNVLPGKKIQIKVSYTYLSTPYTSTIFTGTISDIRPISGRDEVVFSAVDALKWLKEQPVNEEAHNLMLVSSAISTILTNVGFSGSTSIEDNGDVITWWWGTQDNAYDSIWELSNVFMGRPFIKGDGTFVFLSRHYIPASSVTIGEAQVNKQIEVGVPWENVRNYVQYSIVPRVEFPSVTIFSLQEKPFFAYGDTAEIIAPYSYNNEQLPAHSVVILTYTANTQADGLGTDITGAFAIILTDYGTEAKLVIQHNTSSLPSGYLTSLTLRGTALSGASRQKVLKQDTTSQATYQKRIWDIETDLIQGYWQAEAFANFIKSKFGTPQKLPVIILEDRPEIQFDDDILWAKKVIFDAPTKGINNQEYQVGGLEHKWLERTGQAVATTFWLEPFWDFSGYWIFSTNIGTKSYFGV